MLRLKKQRFLNRVKQHDRLFVALDSAISCHIQQLSRMKPRADLHLNSSDQVPKGVKLQG